MATFDNLVNPTNTANNHSQCYYPIVFKDIHTTRSIVSFVYGLLLVALYILAEYYLALLKVPNTKKCSGYLITRGTLIFNLLLHSTILIYQIILAVSPCHYWMGQLGCQLLSTASTMLKFAIPLSFSLLLPQIFPPFRQALKDVQITPTVGCTLQWIVAFIFASPNLFSSTISRGVWRDNKNSRIFWSVCRQNVGNQNAMEVGLFWAFSALAAFVIQICLLGFYYYPQYRLPPSSKNAFIYLTLTNLLAFTALSFETELATLLHQPEDVAHFWSELIQHIAFCMTNFIPITIANNGRRQSIKTVTYRRIVEVFEDEINNNNSNESNGIKVSNTFLQVPQEHDSSPKAKHNLLHRRQSLPFCSETAIEEDLLHYTKRAPVTRRQSMIPLQF